MVKVGAQRMLNGCVEELDPKPVACNEGEMTQGMKGALVPKVNSRMTGEPISGGTEAAL